MMTYYTNTLCIVSILSCLFITSSFAGPPVPNVENGTQKLITTQISSRDSKVSASSTVKGLRERPPTSYSIEIESFNTLMKSTYAERYESRPFMIGKYNWTLIVYPKGNKNDNGTGYISLYVAIDKSTFVFPLLEVQADLRFYVFNKKENKYFTMQDTNVFPFSAANPMWGFPRALPLTTFTNLKNGYLYDIDHCEFSVDVIIPPRYEITMEHFSIAKSFPNPKFTWFIHGFSTLPDDYLSEDFIIGGKTWNLRVFRNGVGAQEGKALSVYLYLSQQELLKVKPYEKVYARAKLRVPNQRQSNNDVVGQLDNWFSPQITGWGFDAFVPLSNLRDTSKGLVVHDMLIVQVEMEAISSTKYSV
ncbi:TRAF-like family protein [Raphanus sativus]|uniref:Uncharacterized protein LOC108836140 n=1 Tax=Raphanus sativus TaxID=3726 RepID=A0A9W3BY28_RAPSA|nr:uncharacterized protein LOC108836140 [Raphanus sativus]KAJ4886983.1 TRAF-like family protein [Raphanus sativus]